MTILCDQNMGYNFLRKKIPKSVQIENIDEDSRKANICQYELRR